MLENPTLFVEFVPELLSPRPLQLVTRLLKRLLASLLLLIGLLVGMPIVAQTCPDLTTYYPGAQPDWDALEQRLQALFNSCLRNSEYFALLGAAQLNSGDRTAALESLERALLIDPDNGAAKIDYAQALLDEGQLFSALEINQQVLLREDLPEQLAVELQDRQDRWRTLTRDTRYQLDILTGYDDNLNGAPDSERLTLTLSGEPILLDLNPEYQPVAGPYLNVLLGGNHRRLSPDHQQNWRGEVRGRISEESSSDLLQFSGRYEFIRPDPKRSWQAGLGMDYLFFGGQALFAGTEARGRFQLGTDRACKPFLSGALQHQLFYKQHLLDGIEGEASAGLNCPALGAKGNQQINFDLSLLQNKALKSGRLGGDRAGWRAGVSWQTALADAVLRAQVRYTELEDREGYSPLLDYGARREVNRASLLLQYRRPVIALGRNALLLINIYHQTQRSNIELFRTLESSAEIGFSWGF